MFKVVVIGETGKIGHSLLSHLGQLTLLPKESLDKEKVDFLFLASSKEKNKAYIKHYPHSPTLKIFDFSGLLKDKFLNNSNEVTYGFLPLYDKQKKLVAMPGCSSLAILQSLYPIKELLSTEIFIDVKFSKSALKNNSVSLIGLNENIKGILYNQHPHQLEIQHILNNKKITLAPSVIDIPSGISINIFIANVNYDSILNLLLDYYKLDRQVKIVPTNPQITDVIKTGTTLIHVSPSYSGVIINVVTDNLINNRFLNLL